MMEVMEVVEVVEVVEAVEVVEVEVVRVTVVSGAPDIMTLSGQTMSADQHAIFHSKLIFII